MAKNTVCIAQRGDRGATGGEAGVLGDGGDLRVVSSRDPAEIGREAREADARLVWRTRLPDEALSGDGFDPASVTDVILTHLHFDHGGGSTRADGSIGFPNARHHVQREQFEWACSPAPKDRASFRADDFMPLKKQGRLELHDGPLALADGIEVIPVHGHTPGMQPVKGSDGETTLLYAA